MLRTVKTIVVLFALALVLSPLAAADSAQITIPHNGRVTVLTLDLKKNDSVSFSWTANVSVTFQINDLAGNNYVNQQGQTGSGSWNVPSDNSYVFDFRNTSGISAASVQWTINSTSAAISTTYLLIGVAVVLAVVLIVVWTMVRKRPPSRKQQ